MLKLLKCVIAFVSKSLADKGFKKGKMYEGCERSFKRVHQQPMFANVKCMVSGGLKTTNLSKRTKVNEK